MPDFEEEQKPHFIDVCNNPPNGLVDVDELISLGKYQLTPVGLSDAQVKASLGSTDPEVIIAAVSKDAHRDPRFATMMDRVNRFEVRQVLANEAEDVEKQFEILGIPKEKDGKVLTLWERIQAYRNWPDCGTGLVDLPTA